MSSARPATAPPDIFAELLGETRKQEAADPRPDAPPGSPAFEAWLRRHWRREQARTELEESRELTSDLNDPAPLASEGLAPFISWCRREEQRHRQRGRR